MAAARRFQNAAVCSSGESAEITRRTANELFEELTAELQGNGIEVASPVEEGAATVAATDPTIRGYDEPWAFGDTKLKGGWERVEELECDHLHVARWQRQEYEPFVIYCGFGDYDGMLLALGYKPNRGVIGFVVFGNANSTPYDTTR